MSIMIDGETTRCICETCQSEVVSNKPNGVAPDGWVTGQLWLNISLATQLQIPICFCTTCSVNIENRLAFSILMPVEQPVAEPVADPTPTDGSGGAV